MKLDRAHQSAETQQAQQATGSQEAHRHRHSHGGYAGGMHKGVAYRHAPRAHLPSKRNTGPAPRAKPRPASTGAAGAHPEEEHPRSLADDPWAQAGGGASGMGLMGSVGGGVGGPQSRAGQRPALAQQQASSGAQTGTDAPAPPASRQPPVQEGAALRRSRMPEATLLRSLPREGSPLPMAALLNAYASVYFHGQGTSTSKPMSAAASASASSSGPSSASAWNSPAESASAVEKPGGSAAPPVNAAALRLAAKAALARHLGPDSPSPTLADIRASCVAWCQANGRPPAATQGQRNANLLFPLDAFRAMFRPGSASAAPAALPTPACPMTPEAVNTLPPLNALLQRALEVHTARKEVSS